MKQNINIEAEGNELIKLIPNIKELSKRSGIYIIKCILNNKCYIGSSINIRRRYREYHSDFKNRKSHNQYLQNSFLKYSLANFTFDVLEFCNKEVLIDREKHFINMIKPEYSIDYEVTSNRSSLKSKEYSIKRRKILKDIKKEKGEIALLRKIPFHGEFAGNSKLKEKEVIEIIKLINLNKDDKFIADIYNISREAISKIRHGKNWKHLNYLIKIKTSNKNNYNNKEIVDEVRELSKIKTIKEISTLLNKNYQVIYNIVKRRTYEK